MITHKEYMADSEKLHQAYYLQMATTAGLTAHCLPVSIDKIREALKTDQALNNIRLTLWDACAMAVKGRVLAAARQSGDVAPAVLGQGVCALKALARHLAEEADKAAANQDKASKLKLTREGNPVGASIADRR